jgi:hypothetical protein
VNRAVMWLLLAVVAAAAAVLSFSALMQLAALCGFDARLGWLLPITIDAGAAAGCLVWLGRIGPGNFPGHTAGAASYARSMTLALLASSVAGNATVHALTAYRIVPPWWLVVAVSAVPPVVLGATVHLAVLVGRPGNASSKLDEAFGGPGEDSSGWAPGDPGAAPGEAGEPAGDAGGPAGEDRAAVLIAEGAGRRRLAAELDISEHAARRMLDAARNGTREGVWS